MVIYYIIYEFYEFPIMFRRTPKTNHPFSPPRPGPTNGPFQKKLRHRLLRAQSTDGTDAHHGGDQVNHLAFLISGNGSAWHSHSTANELRMQHN